MDERDTGRSPPPKNQAAIERRAFELWLERGARDGHAVDDWLRAEREITAALQLRQIRFDGR